MTPDLPPSSPPPAAPLALAELMCARLCHDLSGAAGMLSSLLDLATSASREADEGLAEARRTAAELSERLIVLRAAWTSSGDEMPADRLAALAAGFLRQKRISADLSGLSGASPLPAPVARLIVNALLLCAEALARGGTVAASGDPAHALLFEIAGPGAAWPAGLAAAAAGPAAALAELDDPRRLQAPLTAALAAGQGMRLSLRQDGAGPPALALERAAPEPAP